MSHRHLEDEAQPLAGRYELLEEIGRGGGGVVRRAVDRLVGRDVAVKTVLRDVGERAARVRREATALELLRVPGVVALLDEVTVGDVTHFVMELVDGAPFPGERPAASWEELAPRAQALLEVLARVHAAGVVHRDLKPGNVLVDRRDAVTLLDFGVSCGAALGPGVTATGAIVGTLEYLAPEQMHGRPVDPRVDIYAVGVMLYDALSGRPAFSEPEFASLVYKKLNGLVEPIEKVAPHVPTRVARAVMACLAPDPEMRPQSARDVLQLLFGQATDDPALASLPRLGTDHAVERLLEDIGLGRSRDVHGESGSGRTRLLLDVAARARELGRTVHWVSNSRVPFASLASVIGEIDGAAFASVEEAGEAARAQLAAVLERGDIVIADEPALTDTWSNAILASCRDRGSVLRVVETPTEESLPVLPISAEDLRPLFAGHQRVFHVPEDAASELWRRTGGNPSRLRAEIAAWVRAGIAEWEGQRLVVSRAELDRLRTGVPVGVEVSATPPGPLARDLDRALAWVQIAWPHATAAQIAAASEQPLWIVESILDALENDGLVRRLPEGVVLPLASSGVLAEWTPEERCAAHAAAAAALPRGSIERIRHLAAAGSSAAVATEAMLLAKVLADDGRIGDSLVALGQAVEAARELGDVDVLSAALQEYASVSLAASTPSQIRQACYVVDRAEPSSAAITELRTFLHRLETALSAEPDAALDALASCPELTHAELECWRRVWLVRIAERASRDQLREQAESFDAWAHRSGEQTSLRAADDVVAAVRWRELRFDEAADRYRAAAERRPFRRHNVVGLLNLGSVLLDAGRVPEAHAAGERALRMAAERRNASLEAYAESLLRDTRYAAREPLVVDEELLAAIEALRDPELAAWSHLREAAVAWRSGDAERTLELAERCASLANGGGSESVSNLARCLAAANGAALDDEALRRLADDIEAGPDRLDICEGLALLTEASSAVGDLRRALRERLAVALGDLESEPRRASGSVLALEEIRGRARLDV